MRFAVLLLGALLVTTGSAAGPRIGDRVHEAVLDNGLRVIVLPVGKAPVVTVQIWYEVGSRNEQLGRTGLSHMLEHMMFKGTERVGPEEFAQIIQRNGGESNAFTSSDYTTYFETLAADRLPLALELEADRMRNLQLVSELFEPERKVVMEERRLRTDDSPWGALWEELGAAAYKAHPYGWPIIGWMGDLETITLDDLVRHYDEYYQPANAIVAIVGSVDPEAAIAEVRKHFGGIPAAPKPPALGIEEPEPRGERRVTVHKEANLPAFAWAHPVPKHGHEDALALEALSTILTGGESSRLYRKLVIEDKIFFDISADYPLLSADPGLFTLTGQMLPGKSVAEGEAALQAEVDRILAEGFTETEVAKALQQAEAGFVFAQDSNFYLAMLLARYELHGDWRDLDGYLEGLRSVTAADVRRVVETYLSPTRRTVAELVPTGPSSSPAGPPPGALH